VFLWVLIAKRLIYWVFMGIFMDMNDYQILMPAEIPSDLVKSIGEIGEFKGQWSVLRNLAPDRLNFLQKVATIASIGSSTRIEGVTLSNGEIEDLLANINHQSFQTRDEEEVAGYADAMELVFSSFADIPLTENHIRQLHKILLKYSSKDVRHAGEYKKLPNSVEAFDAEGKSIGTVFKTATPFQTPFFMKSIIEWHEQALKDNIHHPLLVIAAFVVHFLAVHPFQDGNGRLSRVLTTLLLLRQGYRYVPYCSLESIVEENKDRYYRALRRAQQSFTEDHGGLMEWFRFFVNILKKQKDLLAEKISKEKKLSMTGLNPETVKILELAGERGKLTIAEITVLTGANRNTVKVRLKRLCRENLLQKHGAGKGTWYSITNRTP
jgi:Fic family protein